MTKRPPQERLPVPGGEFDFSALSHLAPELATTFAAVAGDLALVVDADGVISSVATAGERATLPPGADWVGRRWADTVTDDTRRKIEQLVEETNARGLSRRREVTLRSADGADIPVAFTAIRLGQSGPLLAVGQDLRAIAAIQQRFIESQQELERDYWRRRQGEARYRLLFQVATDAVIVVDGLSHQVVEANRAAATLFGQLQASLPGRPVGVGFGDAARQAVSDLLTSTQTHGRPGEIRVRSDGRVLNVSAAPFLADGVPLLLVRLREVVAADDADASLGRLIELVERSPDAIVVTDGSGRIRSANPAFAVLCQLSRDADLTGRSLSEWIGHAPREVADLLEAVRRQGITAPLMSRLRAADGLVDVEITAVLLPEGDEDAVGLTIRRRPLRVAADEAVFGDLARAVERLASRLGSLRLPSLMREGADLVERHLLQAALARAADDAAAAQLLGISEDSLQLRLKRHGLRPGGELPALTV